MGEILEYAAQPFAVVDLDWLCWAWTQADQTQADQAETGQTEPDQ